MLNGVSIIICGYNSSSRITPTLEALQKQRFINQPASWEVILVDNASTDNTRQTAEEVWKRDPVTTLKIVSEEKPGLMNARKRGLEAAAFGIVSFIDDDNWVEPDWIQKVMEVFASDDKIGACGGRNEAVFEKTKPEWFDEYQNNFAVGPQSERSGIVDDNKGFLWGAGLSFRKSIWEELKKRNYGNLTLDREGKTLSSGGDTELCYVFRLLGYHLYYRHDLTLKHFMPEGRMNFSYLEKMNEGFGKANVHLNCYRAILNPGFRIHSWWYEWLATERKIIGEFFKSIFSTDQHLVRKSRAKKAYWKGYAAQTWNEKSTVNQYVAYLKEIFAAR